jgi:hypothetical protein
LTKRGKCGWTNAPTPTDSTDWTGRRRALDQKRILVSVSKLAPGGQRASLYLAVSMPPREGRRASFSTIEADGRAMATPVTKRSRVQLELASRYAGDVW